ncbi:FAD/NAD(P)-binding protein [Dongshaea marina]|uniref:FAD/NAD(P)-binding protein n=1 Tax=Dongshaea marina TaxID=2047966 RepID=UPI00131F4322|nr:FAD/NAD(P)-binding protein [Dongshaea marina]
MSNCKCHEKDVFMPIECEIVHVEQVTDTEKYYTLLPSDPSVMEFEPGQILEVSLFGYGEIPIGYASSPTRKKTFDIVVRSVGRVSTAINNLKQGDSLFVRGPLGTGFPLDDLRDNNILIVAGGIGLCPTRSLIKYILDRRNEFKKFSLFFGARSPSEQLFLQDLAHWRRSNDVDYFETVDKADASWQGNVGVITTLFDQAQIDPDTKVIVCGPPVMYKFVIQKLLDIGVTEDSIYLDLERRMKCGIGKCGHCQINDRYTCVDGAVFSFSEIKHLGEAFDDEPWRSLHALISPL